MSISNKIRKNLWAKSGNRCSICRKELFNKKEDSNEFNIGEECHIISSKPKGPRYMEIMNFDTFDNLILLCRNHHKEIDELTDTYSEEVLKKIKANHEKWVATTLDKSISNKEKQSVRFLPKIASGKTLLNIICGAHGLKSDYDEIDKDTTDYLGGVFQTLTDIGDICPDLLLSEQINLGSELMEILSDLDEKGFSLFAERKKGKVKYNNGQTDNWDIAMIIIKKTKENGIFMIDKTDINF